MHDLSTCLNVICFKFLDVGMRIGCCLLSFLLEYLIKNQEVKVNHVLIIVWILSRYPGTGQYDKFFEEGVYKCAGCGTPLYRSTTKFNSGCGWPAFYEGLPGAINRNVSFLPPHAILPSFLFRQS